MVLVTSSPVWFQLARWYLLHLKQSFTTPIHFGGLRIPFWPLCLRIGTGLPYRFDYPLASFPYGWPIVYLSCCSRGDWGIWEERREVGYCSIFWPRCFIKPIINPINIFMGCFWLKVVHYLLYLWDTVHITWILFMVYRLSIKTWHTEHLQGLSDYEHDLYLKYKRTLHKGKTLWRTCLTDFRPHTFQYRATEILIEWAVPLTSRGVHIDDHSSRAWMEQFIGTLYKNIHVLMRMHPLEDDLHVRAAADKNGII